MYIYNFEIHIHARGSRFGAKPNEKYMSRRYCGPQHIHKYIAYICESLRTYSWAYIIWKIFFFSKNNTIMMIQWHLYREQLFFRFVSQQSEYYILLPHTHMRYIPKCLCFGLAMQINKHLKRIYTRECTIMHVYMCVVVCNLTCCVRSSTHTRIFENPL